MTSDGTELSYVPEEAQRQRQGNFCFWIALTVNFVDQLWQFTQPVQVPFGLVLGADLKTIALFATVRGLGGMLSNIWMPWLADGPKGGKPRRRLAVLVSLIGCSAGYLIQGLAIMFKAGAEAAHVHMVGRFVVGFFSGMGGVIAAYITEISQDDDELLRNRFKYFQVSNSMCGVCFAPLAGVIASFGLELPFYVAAGLGVFTLILAFAFFKESSELVQNSTSEISGAEAKDSSSPHVNCKAIVEGSPYCDPVAWLIAMGNVFIVLIIAGFEMFLPALISQPSFGIPGQTLASKQQHVATATSLLLVPFSLFSILGAVALFVPVTKRFGDILSAFVAGMIGVCSFTMTGFITRGLWILAILNSIGGLLMGIVTPAFGPMYARYSKNTFPSQQATAQGIPLMAGQICLLISQNIMAVVLSDFNIPSGSVYLGACLAGYISTFCLASLIAQRSEPQKLSENQESLLASAGHEKDPSTSPTLLSSQSDQSEKSKKFFEGC